MGGGCGIRMAWLENFLKIDNWGGHLLETWDINHDIMTRYYFLRKASKYEAYKKIEL